MVIVSVLAEISKTLTNSPSPGRFQRSQGFPSWHSPGCERTSQTLVVKNGSWMLSKL
jgi:hypothetical protein